ncbi:MAG TPA: hypothetical protein VF070_23895 [Streptosporangiaceae bacterium]
MFFFFLPPPLRIAIGVVILVLGVALHRVLLDLAGAALIVIAAGQLLYRRRTTGKSER